MNNRKRKDRERKKTKRDREMELILLEFQRVFKKQDITEPYIPRSRVFTIGEDKK